MPYFSDREQCHISEQSSMLISVNVWNGIAILVNSLIANNNLAKDFPRQCPDWNGICGVDEHGLYTSAKSVIPKINFLPEYGSIETLSSSFWEPNPFEDDKTSQEHTKKQFTYDVLDFIEFIFKHICDVQNGQYHNFFHHFELKFLTTTLVREQFVLNVNEIFTRNNIAFKLTSTGEIHRIIVPELNNLIDSSIKPTDEILLDLLHEATIKIKSPKIEERKIALERLWDAFERLKTIINPNDKKDSANHLLERVSYDNQEFKQLFYDECIKLTKIGNEFQIRHFETGKVPIENSEHIDYLFFRMYALIDLFLKKL